MRLVHKLFLVAATVMATTAFASPAANAVQVTVEPGGANCPEVQVNNAHAITGGCLITGATAAGTSFDFRLHVGGVETVVTQCTSTFSARVHRSGDGWIFNQVFTGANCGLVACDEASGVKYEWPFTIMEFGGTAPNAQAFQFTFCTRSASTGPGTSFGTCTIFIPLNTLASPVHNYQLQTLAPGPSNPPGAAPPLQSRCSQNAVVSFTGTFQINGTGVEITH